MPGYKEIPNWWAGNVTMPTVNSGYAPSLVPFISSLLRVRTLGSLIGLFILLKCLYNLFLHPLRKIPGPFLARASELWRSHKYFRGTWHDDVNELHRKYGPVVRISPREVSFVDVNGLKSLYGHGKQVTKAHWYDVHRFLRSRVSGAYSMTSILAMEPLVQEVMDLNLTKLGGFADRGETLPLDKWANYFTFDVVGQLAMGGMIGFLQQGKDIDGIIQSIHDGFWLMANMGNLPLQMLWFNNPLYKWFVRTLGGTRLNAFDVFLEWLNNRVEQRMTHGLAPGQRRDMLQHFIEVKDPQGLPVKKGDVMIEGVNILGAGADTTTIGILACMGTLLTHPEAKQRLVKEIDDAYMTLGLEGDREISFKEAEKLPYLSAIVCESTRLHPSIQYQLPRNVPAEGVQIGPHFVPRGSVCGVSPMSMNRSQEIFGKDADEFRPERWIAESPEDEERIKRERSLLVTFGMGSRSCVGKNLATVEIYKYIAQFFRHFDADVVDKNKPWKCKTQWFAFQRNFNVRLTRRQH